MAAKLNLNAVIGFAGTVKNGLVLHNDDQRLIFALGSTIVVKTLLKQEQFFLQCGDSNAKVSCIAISNDCKLLATGQQTHPGFPVCYTCFLIFPFCMHFTTTFNDNFQNERINKQT